MAISSLTAQDFSGHNWYFGDSNEGIRFSRSDNSPARITNKANLGTGGSAVATDPVNGNLLFYTDGLSVYDVTHTAMPNGLNVLAGNPAGNQTVAVAKRPGSETEYYIFTNTANGATGGTISYTIVDMGAFGHAAFPSPPRGDVDPARTNVPIGGLTNRSEAMIVIPHENGEDFWLITRENGIPNYSITLFDETTEGPVSTNTTTLGLINRAANFSYHKGTGRIAVSPQEANRAVEILVFDPDTGTLEADTQGFRIPNSGVSSATSQAIYDIEWSNSGQYLYISIHGEPGVQADVIQYDFENPNATMPSVLPQPNTIFRSFGLQMAPDSAIYHLYQATTGGPFLLGTLTNTDTVAHEVDYAASAFEGNPDFNAMQFPAFAPKDSIEFTVDFTTAGTCANSPVSFYPTVVPTADSLVWNFGDGQFGSGWSPTHIYEEAGTFQVEVVAFLNGDTAYATHPVNLTQFDLQLTVVQDTTACVCELPVNAGKAGCSTTINPFEVTAQAQGGTAPQYQWFGPGGLLPGQTSETLQADSAGYYYLVATENGCSTLAGVNIKEYDSLDQRANIWYFGQNAGIDFNPLPENPAVAINGPLQTPEGTSVISDRNGQVIFSTDGSSIYNKLGQDITPPGGIGGNNTSTQSALIIPVPGDETLYYIFTTNEIYGTGTYEVRYSLFDLKLNNGVGDLAEYNQLLFGPSTERITGDDNWLIAHEYGNNSFRAYPITQAGIGNPVVSDIGSDHMTTSAESGQGYMKLGARNILAVALSTPGVSNVVEIFDFIDSTGVVTNFRTADLNSATGQVYGVELSPAGNKLFATLLNGGSTLYEFAIDSLGEVTFLQSASPGGELGAIQIGPDGQIYVAINGSSTVGTFSANEDEEEMSGIGTLQPFELAPGTTSGLGLPNFIQSISNPTSQPGFNFTGLCLGDSTYFTAVGKDPAIDKFDWVFGDGTPTVSDGGPEIAHLYRDPGTYQVTLTIRNKCETPVQVFTENVVINDVPPAPTDAVSLCMGSVDLDANPDDLPDLTYQWSTGETTETLNVTQQGNYTVTITDALGCSSEGTFLAANPITLPVDLGPDVTICQNSPVPDLRVQSPGSSGSGGLVYAWELNGAPSGTGPTHAVSSAAPGVFEYKVQVTDPETGCYVRDSITFTINAAPVFNVTNNGPIVCNTTTGQITINLVSPTDSYLSYSINGPTPGLGNNQTAPSSITTDPVLAAGTYGIVVTDQVTNCPATATTSINTSALTVSAAQLGTCDPIVLDVTLTATPGPLAYPIAYQVINANTAVDVHPAGSITSGTNFQTSPGLPSNNQEYIVEVTTNDGCVASSDPVAVNENDEVQVELTIDACVDPIVLTASQGEDFLWTGPGTISAPTASSTSVSGLSQGIHEFNLVVQETGFCDLDTTITVNVNNDVIADWTQSDECADQVFLTATPAGPYVYRWYRDGTLIPGGGGRTIIAGPGDHGANYRVDIVNTATGCTFSSAEKTVSVVGELDFRLTATPPCEGQPFTLTATANKTGVNYQWALDGQVLTDQTSATLIETRGGRYDITVSSDGGGCSVTQTYNVTPSPVTEGSLPRSGIICPHPENPDPLTREVALDAGPNFVSYNWFRDGLELNETDQTYTATEAGTYSVDLVNSYGCPSSDEILLIEDCSPRITGPNAFRPSSEVQSNGEYTNRSFRLFTFFIDDQGFEVFIFNRWGEMVYYTTDREFRWNGGYNNNAGRPLPTGTYTYLVRYRSSYRPEDGIQEKRGGVVLLR